MTVTDPDLLASFRGLPCELCGLRPGVGHHVRAKGIGGGARLDIRQNVATACLHCHQATHDGNIPRDAWLKVIAERERTTPAAIEELVCLLLRMPKLMDLNHQRIAKFIAESFERGRAEGKRETLAAVERRGSEYIAGMIQRNAACDLDGFEPQAINECQELLSVISRDCQ